MNSYLDNRRFGDQDAGTGGHADDESIKESAQASANKGDMGNIGARAGGTDSAMGVGATAGGGNLKDIDKTNWNEAGVDTGGGMEPTTDTASGGNWGDDSGLSSNAAGKGAGDWVTGEGGTGYTDPDRNTGNKGGNS